MRDRTTASLPPYHAMPEHLLGALKMLDSPVVAAHWGGSCCGEEVLAKLCGAPIWFDLSFGYGTMAKSMAQQLLQAHGPDKLLFASDMPWHRPEWEKWLIESLDISEADKEKIYWRNATKLLKL